MTYPWTLAAIMHQLQNFYAANAAYNGPAARRHRTAELSHARVRTATRGTYANLRDEAAASDRFNRRVETTHEGRLILWLRLVTPVHLRGHPPLYWLEVTETRPGDANLVDALVYKVPGLPERGKQRLPAPWHNHLLTFQRHNAEDIVPQLAVA